MQINLINLFHYLQGFGNVGQFAARYFVKAGAILVGVILRNLSLYNTKGIDPEVDLYNLFSIEK